MEPAGPFEKRGFLAALRYRNYRFLWSSVLGMTAAASVEMVVIGWLVLEITDSPSMVGLVAACRFVGMVLGPYFGALADRFDRRRLLIALRAGGAVYTLVLVALYSVSLLDVWYIVVLSFIGGVIRAFDFTASNSTTPQTVASPDLASAVSLILVAMGIARMAGPLLGGYLYEEAGAGVCFVVMAGSYILSTILITPMRLERRDKATAEESVWQSVTGGIRYVIGDRAVLAILILAAIANLFAFPVTAGIMPVFARDVLGVASSGLGWLIAAEGLGGLGGSLLVASTGKFRQKGWLLILGMIIWPTFLGLFAISNVFSISLWLILASGVARGIAMTLIQVLLLNWSSPEIHGRVMGARMFAIAALPLGNILCGVGADLWGVDTVIVASAVSCILTVVVTAIWAPQLRQRQ